MKIDMSIEKDPRVREVDGWYDDFEDLPQAFGLFFFVDDNTDVKFVGICKRPTMQEEAKAAYDAGKGKGATKIGYVRTFSVEKAEALYDEVVKKYNPPNN